MELYIIARFHARTGCKSAVQEALEAVLPPTRKEAGCVSIHIFRSLGDPLLFYIQSRWTNEEAFEIHATLPHTVRFIALVETLIDHPLDVSRTRLTA